MKRMTGLKKRDKTDIIHSGGGVSCIDMNGSPKRKQCVFFYSLFAISLLIPSLVFSGISFIETLHLMKWFFALAPIAFITLAGGISLAAKGVNDTGFRIDHFGWTWFLMLLYISFQPLLTHISSWSTYLKGWFFFAGIWAAYIFSYNFFHDQRWHRGILWFANIDATINVIFAEMQFHLERAPFPFVMNVPGKYVGNVGQQNMLALWSAMALLNAAYLYITISREQQKNSSHKIFHILNFVLAAVNAWGLWSASARVVAAGLLIALGVLALAVYRTGGSKTSLKRIGFFTAGIFCMFLIVLSLAMSSGFGRGTELIYKTENMLREPETIGYRRTIWETSWQMVKAHPVAGVGIGHYKWHFLEAQGELQRKNPEREWQYTYWAHSEILQWLAEFGSIGLVLLVSTAVWWVAFFVRAMVQRKALSMEAMWACAMLFLISCTALLTRPYHRAEFMVWYAFAFALANRELFPVAPAQAGFVWERACRIFGGVLAVGALCGLLFLFSGVYGEMCMRNALRTKNVELQLARINKALAIPMTKDDAEEQYAYHLVGRARASQLRRDWEPAIAQLYRAFHIQPKAKEMIDLFSIAQQTDDQELYMELLQMMPKRIVDADGKGLQPEGADGGER